MTDVALSRLGMDELLVELLDRVRDMLSTDTAAVLLMDESKRFLVATAARGLEEEVRQGSRVPLGRGFAGRIAAERRPIILDRVTPTSVVNPVLLLRGVRSMLGVPLLSAGSVLGVLHVATLHARTFTDDDVALLEQVADRLAMAIRTEQAHSDRAAAMVLQRSLAPQQLPSAPGLDLAARYVPGSVHGVGGDWYDVFVLPGGRLGIAIGDVMGHGLHASSVMGRIRSGLRAYALENGDPATVLARLDEYMQRFEPEQTASVVYGVLDPEAFTVRISSAGHLPPLLVQPSGSAEFVDVYEDVTLGVQLDLPRHTTTFAIPRGAVLCLFTDGLIERRSTGIEAGLRRLRHLLSVVPIDNSETVCAEAMARLIGDADTSDDIALLAVRREPGAPANAHTEDHVLP